MPAGRPTDYSQELADVICERLASGESMRRVCQAEDMPAMSTVFRWLRTDTEFRKQYETAKDESADLMAEDIIEISDNSTNDYILTLAGEVEGKDQSEWTKEDIQIIAAKLNKENVQRSRLRVDARKWAASKLKPKKYGDRTVLAGDEDNPLLPGEVVLTVVKPKKRRDPTEG